MNLNADLQIFGDLKSIDPSARDQLHVRLRQTRGTFQNPYSLSHCPIASGLVISRDHRAVGLDLEVHSRLHLKLIQRISTKLEIQRAPIFEGIWVAKESAFKAINMSQSLKVMSQIQIAHWEYQDKKLFFKIKNAVGVGVVEIQNNLILGIYQTPL